MDKEDRFLLSSVEDKMHQCDRGNYPTTTHFLDMRQQSLIQTALTRVPGANYDFDGGYEDAERRICVFLPDYASVDDHYGISCVRVTVSSALPKPLTHRDYLGSLMALGIRRETIGDIIVVENGAYIVCLEEMTAYLLSDYTQCGHARLHVEQVDFSEIQAPKAETIVRRVTVPSLRLDCVASSAYSMSRSAVCNYIEGGKIFVNGLEIIKKDYTLKEGDKLVLRGKGKAVLKNVAGLSKKDRIFIDIEIYK